MDTRGYIDVTALDARKLVAAAFDRSRPQGLGMLHHQPGSVTDEEIDSGMNDKRISYDYLRGRSMKLHLTRDGDKLYWNYGWYDHSDAAQTAVLVEAGMTQEAADATMAEAAAGLKAKNDEYDRTHA